MKITKEILKSLILEVKEEIKEDYYDRRRDFVVKGDEIMKEVEPMIDEFLMSLHTKYSDKITEDYWFASEVFAAIQAKTKDILGLS